MQLEPVRASLGANGRAMQSVHAAMAYTHAA
jgi:hypothetical protein